MDAEKRPRFAQVLVGLWAGIALFWVVGWFGFGPHWLVGISFGIAALNAAVWVWELRRRSRRERDEDEVVEGTE